MKTAVIAGASGLIGQELVKVLVEKNWNRIILLLRKPLLLNLPGVEEVIGDFDDEQHFQHKIKGDVLFICLGTTIKKAGSKKAFLAVDYDLPLRIARIAKANGVSCVSVVSSIGATTPSSNFYIDTKGKMEAGIRSLGFKRTVFVRPSLLLGERKEFRFGEEVAKVFMGVFSWLMIGKLARYKAIQARTVAKAMEVLCDQQPDGVVVAESDDLQLLGK
jgi:uncharacterized protein YbjT (DUF2867 family)